MSVPDNNTFTMNDVRTELGLTYPTSLSACFTASVDSSFDPLYKGSKDRLSNFRNYGAVMEETFGLVTLASDTIENWSPVSWSDCRNALGGTVVGADPFSVEASKPYSDEWYIRRTFLCFNLTSLAGKTCISATLKIGQRSRSGSDTIAVLVSTQGNTIAGVDFNNFTSTHILNGSQSETYQGSCGSQNLYYKTILAVSGDLSIIQGYFGGNLKMALLNYYDHADIEPGTGEEWYYCFFYAGECLTGCQCAPKLTIRYSG